MLLLPAQVGTGKTSLVRQYVHKTFSNNYKSTIGELRSIARSSCPLPLSGLCAGCSNRRCAAGVDFALKLIRWDDHTQVRLQLWDIAGTGPSSSARDLTTLTAADC
jgi:GTPase SAR1 family protein